MEGDGDYMDGAWINACPFQKRLSQGGRRVLEATITTARRERQEKTTKIIDDPESRKLES
jgi:hypothetical protein